MEKKSNHIFGIIAIDVEANRAEVIDVLKNLVTGPDDVHNDVHDDESWRLCVGGDLTMDETEEITADLGRAGALLR
jgi:hypothetical protein